MASRSILEERAIVSLLNQEDESTDDGSDNEIEDHFTSIHVTKSLLLEPYKLTVVGTVRSNKREIPEELKTPVLEKKPTGTSFARAFGFNKDNVNNFFQLLDEIYEKNKYPPNRIYNVDESGLTVVQSRIPQVIGHRGKRQIAALTSAERGSLVTIVVCMNATGHFVPPFVIFPRKNMSSQLMRGCPPGAEGVVHPSGWIQMNIFTDWFKHFIKHTNPTPESRVLLILDGHFSHTRNIDVIDLARDNNVDIISLPPHDTQDAATR
ncbi:hypothetical protein EVAR_78264_1 [Eumeta japonica]|uniref:DDE-1 domain-containing protein n=1 Tax=Eumeta variegata TaxID=151549 RepID=A0A4C1T606_EUMVA|nr:hypothetical protein EVAR_78264_1 [Eumeta japonica]